MTNTLLGTEPAPDAQRDAIHQAIIPAIAAHGTVLLPGQCVSMRDGIAYPVGKVHGIVDPFLTNIVEGGSRFWLCLLPGTVAGMRHHWSHPDFDDEEGCPCPEPKKPFEPDFVRWNNYRDIIAVRLQCDPWTIDDAVSHMIQYGSSSGGPQPGLEGEEGIDWKEFWRVYNECHGTQYSWGDDPFCC